MGLSTLFIGRHLTTETQHYLNNTKVNYEEYALIDVELKAIDNVEWQSIPKGKKSWIVTSRWSAKWLLKHYSKVGCEPLDRIYCLSDKQSGTLQSLGKNRQVADRSHVHSLIEKITQTHSEGALIYLKGNRSLKHINHAFSESDTPFYELEVYHTGLKQVKLTKDHKAYLFFSPSSIDSFIEAGNTMPPLALVLTIGGTTAEIARKRFENEIITSPVQDELAFVQWAVEILKKMQLTTTNNNERLFERAQKTIPGGVNSPVRSFAGIGGIPTFVTRAEGSLLYDANDKSYIDYIASWGPMIFGHAWSPVVKAVSQQLLKSSSYGLASEQEIELAELLTSMVPGADKVRLVNSGTEACMTAVRIARAATNREKIIKFNGCYHGHADTFLVNAGSGALTLGTPSSPGILKAVAESTLTAEFNDLDSVRQLLEKHEIAAIIVEPVAGNMGCIPPQDGFLQGLRELTTAHGALLIFDEVMTGFRLAAGGAQEYFQVTADLVTYGKIIGGGFPVGAVAGGQQWMNLLSPEGPVYQGGTLSGNPIATSAGITMLKELKAKPEVYQVLENTGKRLQDGLTAIFKRNNIPAQINRVGSMISIFFSDHEVSTFSETKAADMKRFAAFFHQMLDMGIHLPPSGYETWFLSTTLTEEYIDYTLMSAEKSIQQFI